jgi:hypothetical protein
MPQQLRREVFLDRVSAEPIESSRLIEDITIIMSMKWQGSLACFYPRDIDCLWCHERCWEYVAN